MVKELFEILEQNNLTISSAESITGGRFSNLIVNEKGASKYHKGAFVCYTNEYKYNVLGVSKDIEIVSKEMAIELAIEARKKANSSIAISFTGNSSSNGIEGKEKGMAWMTVTDGENFITEQYFSNAGSREEIIDDVAQNGLTIILKFLRKFY